MNIDKVQKRFEVLQRLTRELEGMKSTIDDTINQINYIAEELKSK